MLIILQALFLIIQMWQVQTYINFEHLTPNGFGKGILGFGIIEWVFIRATVYELVITLECLLNLVMELVNKLIPCNFEIAASMYILYVS